MASPVPNPLPPGGGEAVASAPALVTVSESGEHGAEIPPLITSATRIPALDGLRGIAILLVLVFHLLDRLPANAGIFRYLVVAGRLAWSGVDLFFVLSGFLIGGILLDAQRSPHYYKTFYLRRAFRILPIYAVLLALAATRNLPVHWAVLGKLYPSNIPWVCYLTLTQNFAMALGMRGLMSLSPTWSLAVEEQFYLTVPLIVRKLSRLHLTRLLVMALVAAPLLRTLLYHFYSRGPIACHRLMPCRADALSLGVLSALACRDRRCWNFLVARRFCPLENCRRPTCRTCNTDLRRAATDVRIDGDDGVLLSRSFLYVLGAVGRFGIARKFPAANPDHSYSDPAWGDCLFHLSVPCADHGSVLANCG